ncbi:MAG: response regulator transcription factor [Actinomycetota bacterium]
MTESIRVALVDDQELVRRGIGMVLDLEPDIEVVAEASNGQEALDLIGTTEVDIVLMDVQMPEMDGLAATRAIKEADGPAVVILTTFERDEYIFEALRSGASGFLLKNAPPEELIDAVRVVTSGEALLSPSVTKRVIGAFTDRDAPVQAEPPKDVEFLTERELDVLGHVAQGLSNAEIADALIVGEATVKTHVSNVLSKLHLRDRVQAVVYAHRHGLV